MLINNRLNWIVTLQRLLALLFLLLPCQLVSAAYNIGPNDVLRISVYGYDDLKIETRISAEGTITFPLIGEVAASGKSNRELEELIAHRLKNGGFIQDAQVSVTVVEHVSQQVSVLGYVNKPGRYPLDSDSSIVDLIAMAGGTTDLGDNTIVLTRIANGKSQKQAFDLRGYLESSQGEAPFKMQQDDVIYVPKSPMFYIYGEVQHPGGYRIEPDISVVKALSIGGGLTLRGTENRIIIKRKDERGILQEIEAELSDTVLKDDVVYVKERWF